jgi:hypothetical protein
MPVRVVCPSCGKALQAEERFLNQKVRCGSCHSDFIATAEGGPSPWGEAPTVVPEWQPTHSGKAVASLVLGIFGMFGWCLPILGLPITIVGLVLGVKGFKSANQGTAVAGVVLNIIGLVLSVINAAIGAYLGATGQHPLFR